MHTRCAALLKDLRSAFIADCPTMQSASAEDLEMFKQLEIQLMPIEVLRECVMPDADAAYICVADAVFKSDLTESVTEETISHGERAKLQIHASRKPVVENSGKDFVHVRVAESWFLNKFCGILLERVAKAMNDCNDREGAIACSRYLVAISLRLLELPRPTQPALLDPLIHLLHRLHGRWLKAHVMNSYAR